MMKPILKLLIVFQLLSTISSQAQRLDRFGADTGSEARGGVTRRIAYEDIKSFYGYIKPGAEASEIRDGKSFFYLYFVINVTLPEVGMRIITPVPDVVMPDKGDVVAENYYENEKDKKNTFDSWIALERAENLNEINNDLSQYKELKWQQLGFNDDSKEAENKTNSVLRLKTSAKQAIAPGLYRIAFTTMKEKEEVKGGFLIQLGSTVGLPGVKLTPNIEAIQLK